MELFDSKATSNMLSLRGQRWPMMLTTTMAAFHPTYSTTSTTVQVRENMTSVWETARHALQARIAKLVETLVVPIRVTSFVFRLAALETARLTVEKVITSLPYHLQYLEESLIVSNALLTLKLTTWRGVTRLNVWLVMVLGSRL